MAKVELKNVTKRFREVVAVNNLSLEIKDKEFLVLLGPSGCGKTTTLRCIAGLETIDEGEIYIENKLVNDLSPRDRNIAMVFQSYALYPHMSVYDNIAFPLKMRKVPKDEIDRRVKNTAELLKISHLLNRFPKQLSGGEAQRVALGRAIVRQPMVFLMDEPLSNLDAKLRIYMRAEIKKLQRELGVTTIYVTHDQAEAMTMGDKVAVMHQGKLLQLDTPKEIYNSPKDIFVAGFIGSPPMNFLECTYVEKNGLSILDAGVFTLSVHKDLAEIIKRKASTSELILGIRPEDVLIYKQQAPPESVEAIVYVVEPLGSETIVDLQVGDNLIKANVRADQKYDPDEKVWITWDKNRMHIFDKKTAKAII